MLDETIKVIVKEAVRESIREEFEKGISYKEQNYRDEVMTTKQLAAYLQCSLPWLTKNIKELNIPYKKLGKEYRFVRSEINSWLIQQNIQKREKLSRVTINNKKNEELRIV